MTTVLEARAVIRGVDMTGAAFASVEENVKRLDKAVGGVAKQIDAVDKIAKAVSPVSSRLNAVVDQVNRVAAATSGLVLEEKRLAAAGESLTRFKGAETALSGMRAEFDQATRSAAALAAQVAATAAAPAELARSYAAAEARVAQTSAALESQRAAVAAARAEFEALDGPLGAVGAAEERLRAGLARTAQAMAEQGRYSSAASAGAHFLAEELGRLQQASARLEGFQAMTGALEKADAALVRAKTNLRSVWQEIAASAAPTRALQNEYSRAEAAVARATQAFEAQKAGVAAARAGFEEIAGPLDHVASAQARLAGEIERVNGAMASQGRIAARASEELAAAVRKEEESQKRKAALLHQFNNEVLPFAGPVILEGVKKSVEAAAEVEQLRFRIRELSRRDPTEAPFADNLADEVAQKYPALTRGKALDTYLELRANAASGDPNAPIDQAKARSNLMIAARAQTAALALGFEMKPSDMQNLLKSVEGSGRANDPRAVEKITDAYIRAKQVFGSAIASDMLRDYTANAKSANFSIGDDQFYLENMVRMSEGNASRLGNEVNQTMASLAGGAMKKQAGQWFVEHGLARANQVVPTGGGNVRIVGGLKDADTLQTDQGKWAATTLRQAIEASGALSEAKITARADMLRAQELQRDPSAKIDDRFLRERAEEGLIAAELAKTGLRSTVTDNLAHFIGNERLIERDVGQLQRASGTDAADRIGENPVAAFKELSEAIGNFSAVLAGPAIKEIGPLLDMIAHRIAGLSAALTGFFKANPQLAPYLSAGGLAAGFAGGGYLTLKLFSGFGSALMGDAKLTGSATALSGSATLLDEAAEALMVAAGKPRALGAPGGRPRTDGPGPGPDLGWGRLLFAATNYVGLALGLSDAPDVGSKGAADNANSTNAYWDRLMARWLPKGWVTPAAPAVPFDTTAPLTPSGARENARSPDLTSGGLFSTYDIDAMRVGEDREAARGHALSELRAAAERFRLDPEVNALFDRDIERRNRNAPEDSPEARRGAAMHDLDKHSDLKVSLDPASKADISVRVTVEPSSDLIRAAASANANASGNLRANVGVSAAGVAPNGQGGIGSR